MNSGEKEVKGQPGVIFFDAAGTLIRLTQPVGRFYAQTAQDHGLGADESRLEIAFRSVWRETPHRAPSPVAREGDDRPWWQKVAFETLQRAEAPPEDFDAEAWFSDLYERFSRPGVWALYEDVLPCLDAVRTHARLAVISNFDGRLRTILDNLGVSGYFEHLFISSEVGAEKPSGEIFRHAIKTMGERPNACLHVGDDEERDGHGASSAGLSTYLVDRPARTLSALGELYV
jgi:putative hydrolase of the HAD superfamily